MGTLTALVLVGAAIPGVLWLGTRWDQHLRRIGAYGPSGTYSGQAEEDRMEVAIESTDGFDATIVSVSEVAGELLVELIALDRSGVNEPAIMWVSAVADDATLEAIERCCASGAIVRCRVVGRRRLELDVDGSLVRVTRLTDHAEPSR